MPEGKPGGPSTATGRQRLVAAFFKPARGQFIVALLLAVVAFSAITQVRAGQVDDTFAGAREQDLIDILNGLAGTTQRSQSEIARLEQTRRDLLSDTEARQAALNQAQTEAATLSILAGLVPVTGPGIRVTIKEIDGPVDVDTMIDTIQELRTAGAEAIQFNGQVRIVAESAFENAEGGILVDGQLLSSPYVIDVIGEPHTLASSGMDFPKGPRYQFEQDGAEVDIQELTSLDIESVRDPVQPQFTEPDPAQ